MTPNAKRRLFGVRKVTIDAPDTAETMRCAEACLGTGYMAEKGTGRLVCAPQPDLIDGHIVESFMGGRYRVTPLEDFTEPEQRRLREIMAELEP